MRQGKGRSACAGSAKLATSSQKGRAIDHYSVDSPIPERTGKNEATWTNRKIGNVYPHKYETDRIPKYGTERCLGLIQVAEGAPANRKNVPEKHLPDSWHPFRIPQIFRKLPHDGLKVPYPHPQPVYFVSYLTTVCPGIRTPQPAFFTTVSRKTKCVSAAI